MDIVLILNLISKSYTCTMNPGILSGLVCNVRLTVKSSPKDLKRESSEVENPQVLWMKLKKRHPGRTEDQWKSTRTDGTIFYHCYKDFEYFKNVKKMEPTQSVTPKHCYQLGE